MHERPCMRKDTRDLSGVELSTELNVTTRERTEPLTLGAVADDFERQLWPHTQ